MPDDPSQTETEWVFNRPKHGWVCFFCGDTFRTLGAAELHFGRKMSDTPACIINAEAFGLVVALRKAEEKVEQLERQILDEDTPKDREMARMRSEHAAALRQVEEDGFARGVAEMRKHGWQLTEERDRPDLYPGPTPLPPMCERVERDAKEIGITLTQAPEPPTPPSSRELPPMR